MDPKRPYSVADDISKFVDDDDYMKTIRSSMLLTTYEARIPAIGSLVPIILKSSALIQGFTSLVRVQLTHFLSAGLVIITGCAPLCI